MSLAKHQLQMFHRFLYQSYVVEPTKYGKDFLLKIAQELSYSPLWKVNDISIV